MLNACMLANTSLLVLRSSGFERGRLYTQFSTLSTIEKISFMRPCSASVSWESSRQKISEIEAKPIKWHHFLRAHSFFFPRTVFVRMSAKNIVRMSAQKPSTYHQPVHSHPPEEREGMWLGDTIRSRLWWYPFALVLSCGWLICLVLWGDHAFQFVDVIVPVVSIFVLHRPHVLPVCLVCVHTFHHAFAPSSVAPLRRCASDV